MSLTLLGDFILNPIGPGVEVLSLGASEVQSMIFANVFAFQSLFHRYMFSVTILIYGGG